MVAPTAAKITSAWDTERHGSRGWPLFLASIQISGLRGWTGESVDFRYPVVAISGVNGAGKSTVLKVAASAYQAPASGSATETFYADDFFPKTPWEDVSGVVLKYSVQQGDNRDSMTLRKPTHRWRGSLDRKVRSSYFLDISRIQPANTQIGYGRIAQEVISLGTTDLLSTAQLSQLNRTLGVKYDQASLDRSEGKQVGILTRAGARYSNFHQGAGEDSVLDLISLVSEAPRYSLIIIDEVEASLHPQAQRGLITELLQLAHDNRLQVILSTHSPYILEQLPSIARVFISLDREMKKQILYGVSADLALNWMDDERHYELDIYCEDDESAYIIDRLIATGAPSALERVRITAVGPASTVIALGEIAAKNKLPRKALCVVDADQQIGVNYILLPGSKAPEFEAVIALSEAHWAIVAERLGRDVGELLDAKDRATQIDNHHAWCKKISTLMGGMMRPSKVWEAIADVWVRDVIGVAESESWCATITDALE